MRQLILGCAIIVLVIWGLILRETTSADEQAMSTPIPKIGDISFSIEGMAAHSPRGNITSTMFIWKYLGDELSIRFMGMFVSIPKYLLTKTVTSYVRQVAQRTNDRYTAKRNGTTTVFLHPRPHNKRRRALAS